MKGKNFLAILKKEKNPKVITLTKSNGLYLYGTNTTVFRSDIVSVFVIDNMETKKVSIEEFDKFYAK